MGKHYIYLCFNKKIFKTFKNSIDFCRVCDYYVIVNKKHLESKKHLGGISNESISKVW